MNYRNRNIVKVFVRVEVYEVGEEYESQTKQLLSNEVHFAGYTHEAQDAKQMDIILNDGLYYIDGGYQSLDDIKQVIDQGAI